MTRVSYDERSVKRIKPTKLLIYLKKFILIHLNFIGFDVHTVIPTPQFKFGGVVGNNVTSVVFEKKIKQDDARIK